MNSYGFSQNRNSHSPSKDQNFRQSVGITNNERFRNTIGFDYNPSSIYRESISNNNRFRNSLDLDMARDLIEQIALGKRPENSSYCKLKNTLS